MSTPLLPSSSRPAGPAYGRAVSPEGALRLDGNEGARTPWRSYPDPRTLVASLAKRWEVGTDAVLVTAGGDDLIDRCCRAFLSPARRLLLPTPTFEMIERYAAATGARIETVRWEGRFPLEDLLSRAGDDVGLVPLVTPNNPTGAVATLEDLRAVSAAFPRSLILLDHAYVEYADRDLTREALELPNLVVLRTFSKAWGLAGCRVGYGLGDPSVLATLREAGAPYAVASPSIQAVAESLSRGPTRLDQHVAQVRRERWELGASLTELGVPPDPSQANFLYLRTASRSRFVQETLRDRGIVVRLFEGRPELDDALRVTLPGDAEDFLRLRRELELILAPEALLLDMDGVLADVSASQLECVRLTARSFGLRVEPATVRSALLERDANDDWALTQRLLARGGVRVSLEETTRRYQELYLGSEGRPGLCERETSLLPRRLLEAWRSRMPLAIVTGRPRAEAMAFLDRQDLADLFETVTCREDAPPKPDPAPVRLTLERLGVSRAWMLGDTPDDMRAAGRAGLLPLGFAPTAGESARGALLGAGAAAVLSNAEELQSWLG